MCHSSSMRYSGDSHISSIGNQCWFVSNRQHGACARVHSHWLGSAPDRAGMGEGRTALADWTGCTRVSQSARETTLHDDVIKCKHFLRYWPFVWGIHRSPVNSPHKGQWRRALMFSLICAWIKRWVNNREAGDLRCHRAHYDVIVMRQSTNQSVCTNRHYSRLCFHQTGHVTTLPISRGKMVDCRQLGWRYWPLTHWGRDKMDAISQTTFSHAFSSMKIFVFWLNFHWNMFTMVQLTIIQHWFR